MALISTILEIKEVLPKFVSNTSTMAQLPNFTETEEKYIVPVIGRDLYDALVAAYDGATLDADETNLVKKIRQVVIAYAFYDDFGLYILTSTDTGFQKIRQGGTEPIRAWEAGEAKTTLLKKAHAGMDVMLAWLFDNKDLFPEWTDSNAYKKFANLLIRTGAEMNDNYTLFQPERSFWIMKNILSDVQLLYIEKTIGKELLVYLRDEAEPTEDEEVCINMIKKALTFYTVAKACKSFSVSFSDQGFTILGDKMMLTGDAQAEQAMDVQLLEMKIEECNREGDSFLELARSELVALYNVEGSEADFKTALALGPLASYTDPSDRTSGNEERKIFVF